MAIDRLTQEELEQLLKQKSEYLTILCKFLELELATREVEI